MSAVDKGRRTRLKVMRHYQSQGYSVSVVERTGRFVKDKDMFGLFDLCAIHPTHGMSLIQITTARPHDHSAYLEFAQKYELCLVDTEVVQYVFRGRDKFDSYFYKPGKITKNPGIELRALNLSS